MKTAIYIEDGKVQLVLTPENDWEKSAIGTFEEFQTKLSIHRGSFYECKGGYIRNDKSDDSLMMTIRRVID